MSTVIRPSGPLPPRVYWVRRILLGGLLVVLVTAGWWVFAPDGDGRAPDAAEGTPTDSAQAAAATPTDSVTTSAGTPRDTRPGDTEPAAGAGAADGTKPPPARPTTTQPTKGRPTETEPTSQPTRRPTKTRETQTPLAEPTGPCDPSQVDMEIDVSDSVVGKTNVATLILSSTDTAACTLAITPDSLVTRVTSGNDVVWSSSDCPQEVLAKEIVVRADPPSAYQFVWDGSRSTAECRAAGTPPDPGGYWVEAAVVGGEPHRAFFDLTR